MQPINDPRLQGRLTIKEQCDTNLANNYFNMNSSVLKNKKPTVAQKEMLDQLELGG